MILIFLRQYWQQIAIVGVLVVLFLGVRHWHLSAIENGITEAKDEWQREAQKEYIERQATNEESAKLLRQSIAQNNNNIPANTKRNADSLRDLITSRTDSTTIADCPSATADSNGNSNADTDDKARTDHRDRIIASLSKAYSQQEQVALTCAANVGLSADALEKAER